jgi:peptide/nickel transport system permease protein
MTHTNTNVDTAHDLEAGTAEAALAAELAELDVPTTALEGMSEKPIPLWLLSVRRFLRHRIAVVSALVLAVIILATLFANLIAPYGETEISPGASFESPGGEFLLGSDSLGRDNFSRLLYGGRISLLVGVSVALLASLIGTVVGVVAGYYGGIVDSVLMRFTDVFLALPGLMVLIVLARILGGSVLDVVFVLVILFWMPLARIIRGQVLALKEREFVEAARALGVPTRRIMARHLIPNLVGLITVDASLSVAAAILAEATLGYLGLGVDAASTATWGNMIGGSEGFLQTAWWLVIFPGAAIVTTVLCINYVGDGLRDALDPTQSK